MKDKFPLRLVPHGNQERPFKAAASVDLLHGQRKNIRQELDYIEADYTSLIRAVRDVLTVCSKAKNKDPRLYWLVGDAFARFLDRLDDLGFHLARQNSTLARDTAVSETSIEKILSFRRRYSKLSMIDPTIPWAKYRDNK